MSTWTWQIPFSLVVGTLAFLGVLAPAVILQYRRFGRLSPIRLLGTAASCVYGVALVAYTLFPLPSVAEACGHRTGAITQTIPGHFLVDIAEEAGRTSWSSVVTSFAVLQVVLNVVLFIPLGMLLRRLCGIGLLASVAIGLAISVAIEATQLTGIWGIYPCGFRVADVDDLIANTAGTSLGALAAPRLMRWMPQPRELAAAAPGPVSRLRRWVGMLLDLTLISTVATAVTIVRQLLHSLLHPESTAAPEPFGAAGTAAAMLLAAAVVLYLPALIGTGASLGQRVLGIAPLWEDETGPTPARRLLRASVVGGTYCGGDVIALGLDSVGLSVLSLLVNVMVTAVLIAAIITAALGDHRGLSGMVSGARMVDARVLSSAGGRRGGARP